MLWWLLVLLCLHRCAKAKLALVSLFLPARSIKLMYNHKNPKTGQASSLIADDVYNIIVKVGASHRLAHSK